LPASTLDCSRRPALLVVGQSHGRAIDHPAKERVSSVRAWRFERPSGVIWSMDRPADGRIARRCLEQGNLAVFVGRMVDSSTN
jgi:hypothetical protein